jgi:hypothetical protein
MAPSALSYASFANDPRGTYEMLQTRRKIAEQLLGKRDPYPTTAGQGLASLGNRFLDYSMMKRAEEADALQAQRRQEAADQATSDEPPLPPFRPPARSAMPPAVQDAGTPATMGATMALNTYDPYSFSEASSDATQARPPSTVADENVPLPPPRPVYDRNAQIAELQANPALADRVRTIMRGESNDPREQQVVGEEIFNQSAARNQPVARTTEMYTGPGSRGYYPSSTFGRGMVDRSMLDTVLRGSDLGGELLSFSPTGNAFGDVARRGAARGYYTNAGTIPGGSETFVTHRPDQLARLEGTRLAGSGPQNILPQAAGGIETGPRSPTLGMQTAALPANPQIQTDIPTQAPPQVHTPDAKVQVAQAGPGDLPVGARPPSPQLRTYDQPTELKQIPPSARERLATRNMLQTDDPQIQAIWGNVVKQEQDKRAYIEKQREEVQKIRAKQFEEQQKDIRARPKNEAEILAKVLDLPPEQAELYYKNYLPKQGPTTADIETDPNIGKPNSLQKSGVPLPPRFVPGIPLKEQMAQNQKDITKSRADYQKASASFGETLDLLNQINTHPGREWGVGSLWDAAKIRGSNAAGLANLVDQARAGAFLRIYETLRGAQGITEKEGEKGTDAINRINRATSKEDFAKATADFENWVRRNMEGLERANNQPVTAWKYNPDDRVAPDKGEVGYRRMGGEAQPKVPVKYIGGNPNVDSSYARIGQ